ncbi:MAG: carbohydrate-binding domain-containing protein, partial [Prevotella sp.]|nr:carbohydrate-binding domain-containing protein [Prevotella sp.]
MMKRLLSITVFIAFALSSLHAAEGDVITITYANESATVDIPESLTGIVMPNVNGAHVVLQSTTTTEEYIYHVSGNTYDGSLTITGAYKLTLQLAGVSIHSTRGAAIDIETGKRVAVVLEEGTVNTLSDCSNGAQKAALYFSGHPEFEGPGTLNVTGNTKHAISAKEELELKTTTGTINVLGAADGDGIHCGKGKMANEHNYFRMEGGIVNINNVSSDGIDSDDYGCLKINGGVINVNVTADGGTGLKCDSILTMTGGMLNIVVSGKDAEGIRTNYDAQLLGGSIVANVSGDGSKGIKGKKKDAMSSSLTVLNGGTITFGGTECTFYLHANNYIDPATGEETKCRAVSADNVITRSDGDIEIFAYGSLSNPFHSDAQVSGEGGTLAIHRAPWLFYYGDFQHDMTAYVELVIDDVRVDDYDNYAIGAFIGEECVGVAVDGYLRIYSRNLDYNDVTFQVFDLENEKPLYDVYASKSVHFVADDMASTYNDPIIISCISRIPGDV